MKSTHPNVELQSTYCSHAQNDWSNHLTSKTTSVQDAPRGAGGRGNFQWLKGATCVAYNIANLAKIDKNLALHLNYQLVVTKDFFEKLSDNFKTKLVCKT